MASSSREKLTGCVAGVARQPWGSSSVASPVAAPLAWFTTVTRTSLRVPRAFCGVARVGTISVSGLAVTANAGTTCTSARFSPLNRLPSDRACTGTVTGNSTPPTASVNVAVNGVGRNGRPNGTSGSSTKREALVA